MIVDRLEVVEAIEVEDAVYHLLGEDRLGAGQAGLLDWFGNRDGTLNTGDVLRWLDHCGAGEPGSGCGSGSSSDSGESGDDPGLGARGLRRES